MSGTVFVVLLTLAVLGLALGLALAILLYFRRKKSSQGNRFPVGTTPVVPIAQPTNPEQDGKQATIQHMQHLNPIPPRLVQVTLPDTVDDWLTSLDPRFNGLYSESLLTGGFDTMEKVKNMQDVDFDIAEVKSGHKKLMVRSLQTAN